MPRKVYDIRLGHYVAVNEANDDTSFNAGEDNSEKSQNPADTSSNVQQAVQNVNKSIDENPKIQQLDVDLNAENKRYEQLKQSLTQTFNTQKQQANDVLTNARDAASAQETMSAYDKVSTNRDVLMAQQKIADMNLKYAQDLNRIELEHAQKLYKIESDRLQVLSTMNNESFSKLPGKYSILNESNIQSAKIYVNPLIGDEYYQAIHNMNDFNYVFEQSSLLYGKDRKGYYVLCIDNDDIARLYETMESVGYSHDAVFSTIMPQLLERNQN